MTQDNYRIILFEGSETLSSGAPLKSHIDERQVSPSAFQTLPCMLC